MNKIYSRPRIKLPKIKIIGNNRSIKQKKYVEKKIKILAIIIIAIFTAKTILDAVLPIFNTLCENRAKSIATIVSNEQATIIMKEHTYDDLFSIEKDMNGNITMIKCNIIYVNEIISDVAVIIQEEINKRGRENGFNDKKENHKNVAIQWINQWSYKYFKFSLGKWKNVFCSQRFD